MQNVDLTAARLAAPTRGLVRRNDLLEAGVGRASIWRRVKENTWEEPYPGVYSLPGHPDTWERRLLAVVLGVQVRGWRSRGEPYVAAASHLSAAYLHRLLDVGRPDSIEVLVPRGCRSRLGKLRLHTSRFLNPEELVVVGGIPATSPARTIVDIAPRLHARRSEQIILDAVRRDLSSVEDLLEELGRRDRRPEAATLAEILSSLTGAEVNLESPLEGRALQLFRRWRLPEPRLQEVIRDREGNFLARVDFCWPAARVVVELDGSAYHRGPFAAAHDRRRRARLEEEGWTVVVLTAEDLHTTSRPRTLARLRTALGAPIAPP